MARRSSGYLLRCTPSPVRRDLSARETQATPVPGSRRASLVAGVAWGGAWSPPSGCRLGGALRELIRLLNPRIRGWANYFRGIVSSRAFTTVDAAIFDAMVRWMRRRHPRKCLSWLRTRYFRSAGLRRWIITATKGGSSGPEGHADLLQASSVPIRRHVKVQAAARAFDPAFRDYFRSLRKTRTQVKAADHMGSFQASRSAQRSRQPQPGRVTAASRKA